MAATVLVGLVARFILFPDQASAASRAADTIGITIPASATEIVGIDDSFPASATDRRCASVRYLLPTTEWRDHVRAYAPGELTKTFRTQLSCDDETYRCAQNSGSVEVDGAPTPSAREAFSPTANTPGTDDATEFDRGVVVIPDCEPGSTLVMWMRLH